MSYFNIVAQTNENTVVTEYESVTKRSDAYQSEAELEKEFIRLLTEQGYEYLHIHTEAELIANLRKKLEEVNGYTFTDSEWKRFFAEALAYKDVSLRMKNKELDLLIVVNMFLTGFDATTLNTLWVDKNLKMHGLIQAYSRTNRILNSIKTFGNVVCFRNLQKRTDDAISLFGDKNASGIVLMQSFNDYYYGYTDKDGNPKPGFVDMIAELSEKFPLTEPQIIGEQNQKDFISLFGAILRMRNLLTSFDEFKGKEILSERDLQDYLGRYQDLRDEWNERRKKGELEDIVDDIVFEIELIKQIEINIDYILMLVAKYHDTHCQDKEVLITIRKAIDASPELRRRMKTIYEFLKKVADFSLSRCLPIEVIFYRRTNMTFSIRYISEKYLQDVKIITSCQDGTKRKREWYGSN